MLTVKIITIFPEIFSSYFNEAIIKKAQGVGAVKLEYYDLRQWTTDVHRSVDDTPYGGGAGMVMKMEPLYKALKQVAGKKAHKVLLSARGRRWTQQVAVEYSQKYKELVLVCGRYEGVDERILELVDEEISIGDYVLTGGELGAMVMVDSIARLLPGVLGNAESLANESHNEPGVLEYPQYTRPEVFKAGRRQLAVPPVLLSGNHAEIDKWRRQQQSIKK
ncbi:MAG: tRNA (guanosine(37)-N1)-methyltransferase TrmD [Candidatus Falkowbacteria bacterium]